MTEQKGKDSVIVNGHRSAMRVDFDSILDDISELRGDKTWLVIHTATAVVGTVGALAYWLVIR